MSVRDPSSKCRESDCFEGYGNFRRGIWLGEPKAKLGGNDQMLVRIECQALL